MCAESPTQIEFVTTPTNDWLIWRGSQSIAMGSSNSKLFRQALLAGDEQRALQLYHSVKELQNLNPSQTSGVLKGKVTPLHLAAKRELKSLFKEFIINGGKPNVEDGRGRTVVHILCSAANGRDPQVGECRAEMLQFLIDYCTQPHKFAPEGEASKPDSLTRPQLLDLNKQDRALNTPLHLAAISGLHRCVEILLAHGVVTYLTNIAGQTAFACAEAAGNKDIVALLEPRMVFTVSSESLLVQDKPSTLRLESYEGVRQQDLVKIKEHLTSTVAEQLDIPLPSAEELLHHFGWSRQLLLDSWLDDPLRCCQQAKVRLPMARQASLVSEVIERQKSVQDVCDICGEASLDGIISNATCYHACCKECWQEYLRQKITTGQVVNIPCPGYQCKQHLSKEMVVKLIPPDVDSKYFKFGIDSFVDSCQNTRWCPHPGCERAVHLPPTSAAGDVASPTVSLEPKGTDGLLRTVDCGEGHFFCWACSKEAHDPCSCETWNIWKVKLVEMGQESQDANEVVDASDLASTSSWIIKHTKPCPKCNCAIQKRSGCNHMTCSKCKHNFCWVCLGRWSLHGSRTGGYFKCNRFRAAEKAQKQVETMRGVAEAADKKKNKKYFKHVFSRYMNHTDSLRYEQALLTSAHEKIETLISNAFVGQHHMMASDDREGKFVKEALRELLKSRLALRASYAMSYYISQDSDRDGLVKLLAPLERSTETLAEMIARPNLCTPKDKIVLATIKSREVRRKFLPEARKHNVCRMFIANEEEEEERDDLDDWFEDEEDDDDDDDDDSYWSDFSDDLTSTEDDEDFDF